MKKQTYDEYFDDRSIIKALVDLRVKTLMKRRHENFLYGISRNGAHPSKSVDDPVAGLMPPRRLWKRPTAAQRRGLSSAQIQKGMIMRTIDLYLHQQGPLDENSWGHALMETVAAIRGMSQGGEEVEFKAPEIRYKQKGHSGGVRTVSIYPLFERVLNAVLSQYLGALFDGLLSDCAYGMRKVAEYSHHKAARRILEMRERVEQRALYVGELDICGFFDVMHHGVIKRALHERTQELARAGLPIVDPRALRLIETFLSSYSFSRNVVSMCRETSSLRQRTAADAWLHAVRPLYAEPCREAIGLPQGSPLSGILTHLVMTDVDRVMNEINRLGGCYVRYVDDMIVVHPDQRVCEAYFGHYREAVAILNLPAHAPVRVKYGPEFYTEKSKLVYQWSAECMPWISFVGYDLSWDGRLRIRKKSLKKEADHLRTLAGEICEAVVTGGERIKRKNAQEAVAVRIRQHLNMRVAGRYNLACNAGLDSQPCWSDGFMLMQQEPEKACCSPLKALDRLRQREQRRIMKVLRLYSSKQCSLEFSYHDGAPFSYYGSVHDGTGKGLYRKQLVWDKGFEGYQ